MLSTMLWLMSRCLELRSSRLLCSFFTTFSRILIYSSLFFSCFITMFSYSRVGFSEIFTYRLLRPLRSYNGFRSRFTFTILFSLLFSSIKS